MEFFVYLLIAIVVLIAAYVGAMKYFEHVSVKYGYDISGSWTRYIPAAAWVILIIMGLLEEIRGDSGELSTKILILVAATIIYGVILFVKTKSILHSILVCLIQTVIGIATALMFVLRLFFGGGSGNRSNSSSGNVNIYEYDNADSANKTVQDPHRIDWEKEDEIAAAWDDER